ncbi:hypothetical protein SUDANB1_05649 [Streptomyces sp. enrichment culture]|uniref:hypothetical protein n=1 Tax=Streptomyces sp. enrichment culture TaxID=1795815 RepID=UPI003F54954B
MGTPADIEQQIAALVAAGDVEALRDLRDRLHARRARKNAGRVTRYMYDPVGWARDVIDWGPDEGLTAYQEDVLDHLPRERRVAVRGPHGLGKTGMASITILWFASTREAAGIDWKVICTASAWRHLAIYLLPEVHKWAKRIKWEVLGRPPYSERHELLTLTLKLAHGAATAVASHKPELIEGAHADSLLYLVDEGKIVPDGTWDAIEGAFSGGRTEGLPEAFALAISTPGAPAGRFYDIHKRAAGLEDWWVRHVTLAEAIAAGRISPAWAEQRAKQWGSDSAMYANRVLGEFHASDEDSVIPLSWVEAAIERWHAWTEAGRPPLEGRRVTGVDVARSGADSTILAHRWGPCVTSLEAHDREDTMQTTARVQAATGDPDEDGVTGSVPVVDSMGVGGGVVDRLRETGHPVLAYTGAAKTRRRSREGEWGFTNTRSAAYWNLRELLEPAYGAEIMLPPDELMIADLTTPTWDVTTGVPPKIKVEPKDDVSARLGRSPDRGDAIAMSFFADFLAASKVSAPTRETPTRPTAAASRYGRSVAQQGTAGVRAPGHGGR